MTAQPFDEAAMDELHKQMTGEVLHPGDAGYGEARSLWNGMIDRYPSLVARCVETRDVVAAVEFARDHGVLLGVKGGGHGASGKAIPDDGLLIDLSPMDAVEIDPGTKTARVGPGARWGDFDAAAQEHGLATTGGVDSRTGVAGLTLGGGIGWLARSFGLSTDNLRRAQVVTAAGDVVWASEDAHADLFWALRGGGGNVGVVTAFEFQLHEVGPEVMVAQAYHPFADAREVFRFYRDFMADAPDEVGCYAFLLRIPPVEPFPEEHHGAKAAALVACYSGDPDAGEDALAPIEGHGDPILAFVDAMPYVALQQSFDDGFPKGERFYGKSAFLPSLPDELIDDLVTHTETLPGPYTAVFFESMGGAVNRVDPGETAFPHRSAAFNLSTTAGWSDPEQDDEVIAWARGFYEMIAPYSTGGVYANYLDRDDDERIENAYQENYERLAAVEAEWDPENLFGLNHKAAPQSDA